MSPFYIKGAPRLFVGATLRIVSEAKIRTVFFVRVDPIPAVPEVHPFPAVSAKAEC